MDQKVGSMTGREAEAAWRLFEINWLVLAAMAAVLAAGVLLSSFSFEPAGAIVSYGFVALYAGFAYYNAKAPHRRDPQVVYVLGATAQTVFATVILAPLSYLAAAANLPLQDANLHAIDQALGLDWKAYITFVNERPLLAEWLRFGYTMIQWPIFLIPVVLCAAHQYRRLQEFILAFTLALIATVAISIFVPAIGVFYHLDLPPSDFVNLKPGAYLAQLQDLPLVRDGSLRRLELFGLAGLVAFPSFHAASAALYAWAFWSVRWFRPVAVVSNVMMFAATPIDGGHYFIDLIAGVAVAALAIMAARLVSRRLADSSSVAATETVVSDSDAGLAVSAARIQSSP
jgi:PAP2 superfamily